MSMALSDWLEEPLSIELTTAEVMADLDAEWAAWEPDGDGSSDLSA